MNDKRQITDDEKALWKLATRDVKNKDALDDFMPVGVKVKITTRGMLDDKKRQPLIKRHPQKTSLITRMIEKDNLKKLATGKTKLDARLDLHGMWLNEAHRAVINFIQTARDSGNRRLLIITGKGGIEGGGRIRAELPLWLQDPQISHLISAINESAPRHGGSGAFYVMLKKF